MDPDDRITLHFYVADFPDNVGIGYTLQEARDCLEADIRSSYGDEGVVFDAIIGGYTYEATLTRPAARRLIADMLGNVRAPSVIRALGIA